MRGCVLFCLSLLEGNFVGLKIRVRVSEFGRYFIVNLELIVFVWSVALAGGCVYLVVVA